MIKKIIPNLALNVKAITAKNTTAKQIANENKSQIVNT